MPVRFTIYPAARLVTYTVEGRATAAAAQGFFAGVLSHPDFRPGFYFLADRREETAVPDTGYVLEAARLIEDNRRRPYPCRWAILVTSPVAYGMARMWGLMVGDTGIDIMPFYEPSDAAEWLGLEREFFCTLAGALDTISPTSL